jgi:Asp-tRNA(Asn)/Glu-tRNA(Gln) amidotransferase A subunit family amidase
MLTKVIDDEGPSAYENAPIAVQIVGKKQTDQALTVIAKVLDKILS